MKPTMKQIRELAQRIGREFRPDRVVLFGSHARLQATADSDVDLLVVLPLAGRPVDKTVELYMNTRPPFPVDLVVRTPETVRERVEMGDDFLRGILGSGVVLYEAAHG